MTGCESSPTLFESDSKQQVVYYMFYTLFEATNGTKNIGKFDLVFFDIVICKCLFQLDHEANETFSWSNRHPWEKLVVWNSSLSSVSGSRDLHLTNRSYP